MAARLPHAAVSADVTRIRVAEADTAAAIAAAKLESQFWHDQMFAALRNHQEAERRIDELEHQLMALQFDERDVAALARAVKDA